MASHSASSWSACVGPLGPVTVADSLADLAGARRLPAGPEWLQFACPGIALMDSRIFNKLADLNWAVSVGRSMPSKWVEQWITSVVALKIRDFRTISSI